MSAQGDYEWNCLPEHILVSILSYLPLHDRYHASLTCQAWYASFISRYLWNTFNFKFYTLEHSNSLQCVDKYGSYLKRLLIELDQNVLENRQNACRVITELSALTERHLTTLSIVFRGENPCLYGGQEFLDALYALFGPASHATRIINTLKHVDLSGLHINLDSKLLDLLSANNLDLEMLNIQNKVLVCKIEPDDILKVIERCRKLNDLRIFNCSLSDEVLLALCEGNRKPLQYLSLVCRREEKYAKDVRSEVWKKLSETNSNLQVKLMFDHTCPLNKVCDVMKRGIPVVELRLETWTTLDDEIQQACNYYRTSLETLVVVPGVPLESPILHDLDRILIDVATSCHRLKALHVYGQYVLHKDTVDAILKLLPTMHDEQTYTLPYTRQQQ